MSLKTWSQLAIQLDYIQVIQFLLKGIQSYIYGGMILATFASLIFLSYLLIASKVQKNRLDDKVIHLITNPVYIYLGCRNEIEENGRSNKLILVLSLFLCLLILMSTIFLAPAAQYWSPSSGMIPRLSFYTYPINTIALIAVTEGIIKNKTYIVVFLTFMFSNIDLTGIASISQFFDYGLIGIYWK